MSHNGYTVQLEPKTVSVGLWEGWLCGTCSVICPAKTTGLQPTWDGVIQEETENPAYQHTGAEQNRQDLISDITPWRSRADLNNPDQYDMRPVLGLCLENI